MNFESHHIVWIAQWYPHEGEPYAGDFIRRHAMAVSQFVPVTVYACFGHDGVEKTEVNSNGQLTEVITYFNHFKIGIEKADKLIFWSRWYRILKNLLIKHEKERGKPAILHSHIILNAGWLGLWAKKKWGIPFIVTEHWAGYMNGFTNGFDAYNSWSKLKCREIIRQAAVVTGVSDALIAQLKNIEPKGNFVRWANVVNEKIFYYEPNIVVNKIPTFIHVSTLTWQKNIVGILTALKIVKTQYPTVLLKIAGPVTDILKSHVLRIGIQNNVQWLGEMDQEKLVNHFRMADALILFSDYESFGCVVIEANATGIPVIVSNLEPLQELVQHGYNGFVAEQGNVNSLSAAMVAIIDIKYTFNKGDISSNTLALFAYPIIGRIMLDLYVSLVKTSPTL